MTTCPACEWLRAIKVESAVLFVFLQALLRLSSFCRNRKDTGRLHGMPCEDIDDTG